MASRDDPKTANSIFLVILTTLSLYLVYLVVKPLLTAMLAAALLAVLAKPLHKSFRKRLGKRRSLASLATCVAVSLLLLLPVATILALLTYESLALYSQAAEFVQKGGLENLSTHPLVDSVRSYLDRYLTVLGGSEVDLRAKFLQQIQSLSRFFISAGQKVASNSVTAVGMLFITIFALYYFLLDGERIVRFISEVIPLPGERTRRLMAKFEAVTHAAFLGTFGVAAVQGFLGGLALALVGYHGIFWGLIMALFSLLPVVGSAIIWAPAGLYTILAGRWGAGLFILAWGAGVISTADNFLRPYLMGGRSGLHPLVILVSVLGGVKQFGMMGIVFGPLVAALGLTLMEMFGEEFGSRKPGTE